MKNSLAIRPQSGIACLFELLAHVKTFPTPLHFAAICSGIGIDEARQAIVSSPFVVVDDQIVPRDHLERIGQMTICEADDQYHQFGAATYCKDGYATWQYPEQPYYTQQEVYAYERIQ